MNIYKSKGEASEETNPENNLIFSISSLHYG